jgi:Transcriptional regulator of heat shock gene
VEKQKVLFLLMFQGNIVKTITLDIPEDLEQAAILSLNLLLNDVLAGLSLEELGEKDIRSLMDRTPYKATMETVLRGMQELLHPEEEEVEIYTSGATNIFKYPELTDSENASKLISALERKEELAGLLKDNESEEKDGSIQVYIGKESPLEDVTDCAVVTAKYHLGNGMQGTLGVIGPKRMDYEKVLKTLTKLIQDMERSF